MMFPESATANDVSRCVNNRQNSVEHPCSSVEGDSSSSPKTVGHDEYCDLVSLAHECNIRKSHLIKTEEEIKTLEKKVELLRLEAKWCFDEKGNRVQPSAEQQSLEICQKIIEYPQLFQDIVKALRLKKLDLQSNQSALSEKCVELEETYQ